MTLTPFFAASDTICASPTSTTTYSYDDVNRLTGITQGSSSVAITYDYLGRRVSLTLPNGTVATYSYDADSELLGITYTPGGTLTYGYDNDRRIISRGGSLFQSILPPAVSSASYNHDNQLTYFSTGAASPTYDLNGNLVSDGINTYSWDARNRLTGISSGPSFSYDGVNRRQSFASSGTTTGYLYDGLNPVEEFQGASVHATLLTGLGIDERFSRTESGTTSTFLTDQLGSTVALAASNGAIATNYGYDAQGNTTVTGIASDSSYQFTGRENDGDGLDYYRARYYNPTWERFIQEDPIGLRGGDADLYRYVGDNPVGYLDPYGLMQLPDDPSGLPPGWTGDPSHRDPNGQRFRDPAGNSLDFHKGRPGQPGYRGKNHWHYNCEGKHLSPGDNAPDPQPAPDPTPAPDPAPDMGPEPDTAGPTPDLDPLDLPDFVIP
jgi:RHS repeat-associated protein